MQVFLLLDRSGSMGSLWSEALGSINGYVQNLPRETNVTLAVFDTVSYDVIRDTTASMWAPLTNADAMPRGGTPLYDSAMRMMQRAVEKNDPRTIFVVMTDGEENSSQKYKQYEVKSMITEFMKRDWETIFLGANFDKVGDVTRSFGVHDAGKFVNIAPQNMRNFMATSTAAMSTDYLMTGLAMSYTDDMKRAAVDTKTVNKT